MAKRVQSPSSINLYKQCPRRYFYQYIVKLPTRPSIHLIRGKVVHSVLEKFFDIDINSMGDEYRFGFKSFMTAYLVKLWNEKKEVIQTLNLTPEELEHYLIESQKMLLGFVDIFSDKLEKKYKELNDLEKAFKALSPVVEEEIKDVDLGIRGFIDAIHEEDGKVKIMDYKTSKKDEITDAYRLQLSIYALLYKLKYNKLPDEVGINFLKFGEKTIPVDEEMMKEAELEVKYIHEMTESEDIEDYPKNITPLCKWNGGKCDFYDTCIRDI